MKNFVLVALILIFILAIIMKTELIIVLGLICLAIVVLIYYIIDFITKDL